MGRVFAGAIALLTILNCSATLFAQAQGTVEGIGFQNCYRPDCWTPMLIDLRPGSTKSDQFQIQVKQEDMDRDHPIFTRTISLTGNVEGAGVRDQKFRMYFKPQPTGDGLPDSMAELQDLLHASLCTSAGKWLAALPITSNILNVDPKTGTFAYHRGTRFVLAVSDGRSAPVWHDYESAMGLLENVMMVPVQPRDLPESELGYDAVDAIVWLSADPAELKAGNDEKFRALESYVRRGGTLVICTPTDWQKMIAFGDLMPVTIEGTDAKTEPEPLRSIGRAGRNIDVAGESLRDGWEQLRGPFTLARAIPKSGTRVIDWIEWKTGDDQTPWLVRRPFGAGSISWIAQDLGDVSVTRALRNWPKIWDHILDLHNNTIVITPETRDDAKNEYKESPAIDVGAAMLSGLELTSKSAWLITLAIVFFIGYWLLAGPGIFTYLATRRRTGMSWFFFAASAIVATVFTGIVVRVTLRGPPEMRHITLVRAVLDEPAHVYSRFGLYIPRDGVEQIELKEMAPNSLATISAFAIHPEHLMNANVPEDPGPEYQVNIRDADSQEPALIRVPYRSTLKKFEADWTGDIGGKIEGSAKLIENGRVEGTLTNGTGKKLRNIYIAFHDDRPNQTFGGDDWILFMPNWDPATSIDLNKKFNPVTSEGKPVALPIFAPGAPSPDRGDEFRALLSTYWQPYWLSGMRIGALGDQKFDDSSQRLEVRSSIPILSFFSRLTPLRNYRGQSPSRFELLRRGARQYDVSAAISAGALVIVAESEDGVPIPIPLEVEGDRIGGAGNTVYQFVLPLDVSALKAATQPTE